MSSTAAQVIDLLCSDDDEETTTTRSGDVANKKRAFCTTNDEGRHVAAKLCHSSKNNNDDDDDDDEIQVVHGTKELLHSNDMMANSNSSISTEDDICIVGSTGPNALEDYPHSRESCVKHAFAANPMLFCLHCYCFVCDVVASECPCWNQHCRATYAEPRWRRMRQERKQKTSGGAPAAPSQPPAPESHQAYLQRMEELEATLLQRIAAHTRQQASRQPGRRNVRGRRHAVDPETLRRAAALARSVASATTRHRTTPRRRTPPRPQPTHQRPAAASAPLVTSLLLPDAHTMLVPTQKAPDTSVKALLDHVAKQSALPASYLVKAPPAQVFTTLLGRNQLESLTFMTNVELGVMNTLIVTGGWLSDEGNDNASTILALVASNPKQDPPTKQDIACFVKVNNTSPRLKVKCTVILASAMLRWKRECAKHTPELRALLHDPRQPFPRQHLVDADIIISSPSFAWTDDVVNNFEFHRVIADDSHSFSKLDFQTARCISGKRRWCLSATPCTASVFDFLPQIAFLSPTGHWQYDKDLHIALGGFRGGSATGFHALVDVLKKCIVRHTKSQQQRWPHQTTPLCSTTSSTTYFNMSSEERLAFGYGSRCTLDSFVENGGPMSAVQQSLLFPMNESFLATTKITALMTELIGLRRVEHAIRAVVYTHYKPMQDACINTLKRLDFAVYHIDEFNDSREETVQKFLHERTDKPAVLLVQLGTGSFGLTPPSAKRVYLMEPILDPALESKITGQEGTVEVKRFVFRYSVESNIVELHRDIAAGRVSLGNGGSLPPEAIKIIAKGMLYRTGSSAATSVLEV